jgi:predicted dehydrogenase
LFVNTSNAAFIDAVRGRLPPAAEVERFYFRFHTNGPYRGRAIAVDLMPHAISLLIRLLGRRAVSAFREDCAETLYRCEFSYGSCAVELEFRQGHGGARDLAFRVGEREVRRVQEGSGASYRVYLHDTQAGDRVEIEDPFTTYISRFLRYVAQPMGSRRDEAEEALANMRLMAQVLAHTPQDEGI